MSGPRARLADLAGCWSAALERELSAAVALRHDLHRAPCLSGAEHPARDRIAAALGDAVALEPVADSGGVGRLGPERGRAVAVRAELDALPLTERTGAACSATNGAMHACGHDVHQAALVALVRAAAGLDLPVGLVPVLQPREESYPSGARDIVAAGALSRFGVAHMIGAHVHPGVAVSAVAAGAGFVNAAADEIEIRLQGRGGHGAYPHTASDTVAAVAQIAMALPEVVRRAVSPLSPALLSIGTLTAGDGAANVLPAHARILATMRTTDPEDRIRLFHAVRQLADGVAAGFGTVAEVTICEGEPALINDSGLAEGADAWLARLGVDRAEPMRSLGADDFSYFGAAVPSLMMFVGVETEGAADPVDRPSLHDPRFFPSDASVAAVARALLVGYLAAAEAIVDADGA
ncbi:M20 metallopeptidase family protein [Microbacterium sp.]|uniref:M20 metallopeptidase family protein n=1 Tax=Microbacterium sp. TaxID=51671 RepID=UPI003A893C63